MVLAFVIIFGEVIILLFMVVSNYWGASIENYLNETCSSGGGCITPK